MSTLFMRRALLALSLFTSFVLAQIPEIEPNQNKAQALANGPIVLSAAGPNTSITGVTLGTATTGLGINTVDMHLIETAPLPLGIYEHRLTITTGGTAGHIGTIRGLSQTGSAINVTSDVAAQTSATTTTPPRFNQWYGFGKQERIFWRVSGNASTNAAYTAALLSTLVTPLDAGTSPFCDRT